MIPHMFRPNFLEPSPQDEDDEDIKQLSPQERIILQAVAEGDEERLREFKLSRDVRSKFERIVRHRFEDFYLDALEEFGVSGEVEEMEVLQNTGEHMVSTTTNSDGSRDAIIVNINLTIMRMQLFNIPLVFSFTYLSTRWLERYLCLSVCLPACLSVCLFSSMVMCT